MLLEAVEDIMIDNAEVYLNQSWSAVVRRWDCDTEEGFGEGKVKGQEIRVWKMR